MAWKKVIREDTFQGSDAPFITITSHMFWFNAVFVRLASLEPSHRVMIYVDEKDRKVGFEFHKEQLPDSFALGTGGPARNRKGMGCTSVGVFARNPWIAAVSKHGPKYRRFTPKKEGNLWAIQLCPAFEVRRARESADIPADHSGVYRYLRETGEIVYIGRGAIKARLASPERAEWTFDTVEYSVVDDPDEQVKWEDYWLERFKADHGGDRPIYNKISGSSKFKEQGR